MGEQRQNMYALKGHPIQEPKALALGIEKKKEISPERAHYSLQEICVGLRTERPFRAWFWDVLLSQTCRFGLTNRLPFQGKENKRTGWKPIIHILVSGHFHGNIKILLCEVK